MKQIFFIHYVFADFTALRTLFLLFCSFITNWIQMFVREFFFCFVFLNCSKINWIFNELRLCVYFFLQNHINSVQNLQTLPIFRCVLAFYLPGRCSWYETSTICGASWYKDAEWELNKSMLNLYAQSVTAISPLGLLNDSKNQDAVTQRWSSDPSKNTKNGAQSVRTISNHHEIDHRCQRRRFAESNFPRTTTSLVPLALKSKNKERTWQKER